MTLTMFTRFSLSCLSAIVVNAIVSWWFIILISPMAVFYLIIMKFYIATSRYVHGYIKLWIRNWTANQGPFNFYYLTWWTWCLAPTLQFPDTRSSIDIRYGNFSGIWKLHFILVDLVSAAATGHLDRISSAQCLWSFYAQCLRTYLPTQIYKAFDWKWTFF